MVLFTSWEYIIFLVFSVIAFYIVKKNFRPIVLVLLGIIFYFYYANLYVLLIIFEARAYFLVRHRTKRLFLLSILISVGLLVYFKYRFLFFGLIKNNLAIPLGISFFTFEFIHYIVDGYKGKIENPNLKDHFAFIFFFPSMVAGPIKRYQEFVPQIYSSVFSWDNVLSGTLRIVVGFVKKIVIADTLALFSDNLINTDFLASASPEQVAFRLLAFSFKIYMDFSGYTDIALGSAMLFGIKLPENFNWPYLARNIAQFWRRWHMTLTRWFIDYVYKPLGGSKKSILFTLLNVLLVMALSGLWHGAAWNFLIWGLYHGFFLMLYHLYKYFELPRIPAIISIPLTFIVVTLGWAFFLAPFPIAKVILLKLISF
ncbi:MAG TPA: MBOAT family O-acyltransferase [Candidatus Nanoarchaeia archaeon]|nr:MBOAT family O-acyltransferase [Candidatus Nanoarchaeia archaeon]